jgi:hypothetical protein
MLTMSLENTWKIGIPETSFADNSKPSNESVMENNWPTTPWTSTRVAPVAPAAGAVSKKSPITSRLEAGPVAPKLMPTLKFTGSK